MKIIDALFEWDRPITNGERIQYRILELVVISVSIYNAWKWGFYISNLSEVFLPLGIAKYIDLSPILGTRLMLINALIITVSLILAFTRKWKFSYLVALLCFHLHYTARFSQGEISHGSNLAGMIFLCFAASNIMFNTEQKIIRSSLGFCYFFIGLGYMSAGFSKLVGTGITWSDGNHLNLFMEQRAIDVYSKFGIQGYNWLQDLAINSRFIGTAILSFGLLVELSGFMFWFRKTRWTQTTLLLSMHLGIVITMNIYFGDYFYQLLVLGYPWHLIIDRFYKGKSLSPELKQQQQT